MKLFQVKMLEFIIVMVWLRRTLANTNWKKYILNVTGVQLLVKLFCLTVYTWKSSLYYAWHVPHKTFEIYEKIVYLTYISNK